MPPRNHSRIPAYRLHKASGQALVTLNGQDVYLGVHGTKASRMAYARAIAEWEANGRNLPARDRSQMLSMNMLVDAFWQHALEYYRNPDGSVGKECSCFKSVLSILVDLYGDSLACGFGPLALKAVRERMIEKGWSRVSVNRAVNRVRHVFKWAVSMEMVPPSIHEALRTVDGLKRGRTRAPETEPVKPVPMDRVHAIEPFVSRQVWAMIQLQLLSGCRPGEVVIMRAIDLDTSSLVWVYRPATHKASWRGHDRSIYLGPRAQEVVESFLAGRSLEAYLFSPAEAEQGRREQMHANRRTPLSCGNRPGSNRRRKPKRKPRDRYDVNSYRRAIERACDQACPHPELGDGQQCGLCDVEKQELRAWRRMNRWSPHQLRHTRATELRREFGLDAARVILGHRSPQVTEIYAELDHARAAEIMSRVG